MQLPAEYFLVKVTGIIQVDSRKGNVFPCCPLSLSGRGREHQPEKWPPIHCSCFLKMCLFWLASRLLFLFLVVVRTKLIYSNAWNFAKLNSSLFSQNICHLCVLIPDKSNGSLDIYVFTWKKKVIVGTAFLKELCTHLAHLHFYRMVSHLLKVVLVGGVGVSVSRAIYASSLEDNRNTYFDLTFSENVVQETE